MSRIQTLRWVFFCNNMPFVSEAQRRFMYAKHPEIAKRWSKKYGSKIQPHAKKKKKYNFKKAEKKLGVVQR